VQADGTSPDPAHRDAGLANSLPSPDAIALARKYGQSAAFWIDGASMWITGALVATSDIRLRA